MTLAPRGDGKLEVELYPWSDGIEQKNKIQNLKLLLLVVMLN